MLLPESLGNLFRSCRITLKHQFPILDKNDVAASNGTRAADDNGLADNSTSNWQRGMSDSEEIAYSRVLIANKLRFHQDFCNCLRANYWRGKQSENFFFEWSKLSHD